MSNIFVYFLCIFHMCVCTAGWCVLCGYPTVWVWFCISIIVYVAQILIFFLKRNFRLPKSHKFLSCLPHLFHYSPFPSLAIVLSLHVHTCMCIYMYQLLLFISESLERTSSSLKTSVCVSLKQENSVMYPGTTIKIGKSALREGCHPSLFEFPPSPH